MSPPLLRSYDLLPPRHFLWINFSQWSSFLSFFLSSSRLEIGCIKSHRDNILFHSFWYESKLSKFHKIMQNDEINQLLKALSSGRATMKACEPSLPACWPGLELKGIGVPGSGGVLALSPACRLALELKVTPFQGYALSKARGTIKAWSLFSRALTGLWN